VVRSARSTVSIWVGALALVSSLAPLHTVAASAPVLLPGPSLPDTESDLQRLKAYDEALSSLTEELAYIVLLDWGARPLPSAARELPAAIGISRGETSSMLEEIRYLDEVRGPAALVGLMAVGAPVSAAVEAVLGTNLPSSEGVRPEIGTTVYLQAYDDLLEPWAKLMGLDLPPMPDRSSPSGSTVVDTAPSPTIATTVAPAAATAPTVTPTVAPLTDATDGAVPQATVPAATEGSSRPATEMIAALAAVAAVIALLVGLVIRRRGRGSPRHAAISDHVLDAGRTIMAAVDLEGFLRCVADQIGRLVGDDGAVIVDAHRWVPEGRHLPGPEALERVMSTGRSVTVDDATVVPIVAGGHVVGALVSWSRRPLVDETLGAFAPLVGAALQGVRSRIEHEHLAFDDGLTGIGNRRRFDRDLERFVGIEGRGLPVALAMIDVDHFKHFNDLHGHQTGDAVLQHVASVIAANVREGDLVYRYGGEEFAVLLPGAELHEALEVVERVRVVIAATPLPGPTLASVPPVTVSIGVSVTPPADGAAMVRAADGALYGAKSGGRNRVHSFVPS
jgi:diguanylate cyclase (GGDEF)-like protein